MICSVGHKEAHGTDKLIAASIQWAEKIMEKIDERFSAGGRCQ